MRRLDRSDETWRKCLVWLGTSEMERDCMIGHGAAGMLEERLCKVSDKFVLRVCPKCNVVRNSHDKCRECGGIPLVSCNIPYASKLMFQELNAMLFKTLIVPKM